MSCGVVKVSTTPETFEVVAKSFDNWPAELCGSFGIELNRPITRAWLEKQAAERREFLVRDQVRGIEHGPAPHIDRGPVIGFGR